MTALQQLNGYLASVRRRLQWLAAARGTAAVATGALLLTVVLVLVSDHFQFAPGLVATLRFVLFATLLALLGVLLLWPLWRLSRTATARRIERDIPALEQRLLTAVERGRDQDLFAELLAEDTLRLAAARPSNRFAPAPFLAGLATVAFVFVLVLSWLVLRAPGAIGYGASLFWLGNGRAAAGPLYAIDVAPGNRTLRRKADQLIHANLRGFSAPDVTLHARYQSASKWDQIAMQTQPGGGYSFRLSALPDSLEYFVRAGSIESRHYTLTVKDLPRIKDLQVRVDAPSYLHLASLTLHGSGDIRAVRGSKARVSVLADAPLTGAALVFDHGARVPLEQEDNGRQAAQFAVTRNGSYHVAMADGGEWIRLSEDYIIEARADAPPEVAISRPGHDTKVSPIEELPIRVTASDDFGLDSVDLHYSVNGEPEKTVSLSHSKGLKQVESATMLALEDFHLAPGDLVTLYATARDAEKTSRSDMIFAQALPFDLTFRQSQQMGGGGGGAAGNESANIVERQKEIIAATWNEQKRGANQPRAATEEGKFLSDVEAKLGAQATTMAQRMRSRELSGAGSGFESFSKEMDRAASEIKTAAAELGRASWHNALPPEQRALQALLRADAMFRDIQIAFSRGGGGGGAGGAGRDLERMFDLELDTDKNQYETGQSASAGAGEQRNQLDAALERLKALAQRQQELAGQSSQEAQFQQRWEQEMLRREAEQLQQQLQQLSQNSLSRQGSSGQRGNQSAGGSSAGRQETESSGSQQGAESARMQDSLRALRQAQEEMRKAAGGGDAAARQRAGNYLAQAQDALAQLRRKESGDSLGEMVRQAQRLADQERDVQARLQQQMGGSASPNIGAAPIGPLRGRGRWYYNAAPPPGHASPEAAQLARDKDEMANKLDQLERRLQQQAQTLRAQQPEAWSKLNRALSDAEQQELTLRMRKGAEFLRQGQTSEAWLREGTVANGVEQLTSQLESARSALEQGGNRQRTSREAGQRRALAQVEQLRRELERRQTAEAGSGQSPTAASPGSSGNGQQAASNQGGRSPGTPGTSWRGGGGPAISGTNPASTRDALLSLERQLGRTDRQLAHDLNETAALLQRWEGADPALLDARLRQQALPALARIEAELRRQVEGTAAHARTGAAEAVSDQYRQAVADYFRRLSQ